MVSVQCGGASADATTPSDGGSGQFDPICPNGVASTEKVSTANTEKCVSCNSGFGLDGEICREQFDPICPDGVASTEKVLTANTEKCVSCNGGFEKNGELCRPFNFICPNGVPLTGEAPGKNMVMCTSCDDYYALKRDETCAEVQVITLAGTGAVGDMNGAGGSAKFNEPSGVAVDSDGVVYVADSHNHRIRKITPPSNGIGMGTVSTLAGTNAMGDFNEPSGVAVDSDKNVYVADRRNHRIQKITPNRVVTTLAGTGMKIGEMGGMVKGGAFSDDVDTNGDSMLDPGSAQFSQPYGVAVDSDKNVYVADIANHRIRKITSTGVVSTLAGTDAMGDFNQPFGVAVDSSGNVYVADTSNERIRKISNTMGMGMGMVKTLAGSGLALTRGVAVDGDDNVYVVDGGHRIHKITPSGVISTLAGTRASGDMNGAGGSAQFFSPYGVAVDSDGNVYVADTFNHRIRKITIPQ